MQRPAEEIIEWNLKKIDSGARHLHRRLNEILLRVKDCHYDALRANLIVNNMMMSMDHLEEDINSLCNTLRIEDDGLLPRETSRKEICDSRKSTSAEGLTKIDAREGKWQADQTYMLEHSVDSASFNNVVKQVKALEGIVLSGNITQRLEKLETDQTSTNVQQRLETVERELLGDMCSQIEMLKAETENEINGKIVSLETKVHHIVKGVFGGESGIDENSVCVLSKLTEFGNLLNEGRAEIQSLTQKVDHLESLEKESSDQDTDYGSIEWFPWNSYEDGDSIDWSPCNVNEDSSSIDWTGFNFDGYNNDSFYPHYNPSGSTHSGNHCQTISQNQRSGPTAKQVEPTAVETESLDNSEDQSDVTEIYTKGSVEFSVRISHNGPWNCSAVMRCTSFVEYNTGDAFDENKCWFVPPVAGLYKFFVRMTRTNNGFTNLHAWTCDVARGGWGTCLFVVIFPYNKRCKCAVQEQYLEAGMALRLRIDGGTEIDDCVFKGRLLRAGAE